LKTAYSKSQCQNYIQANQREEK